MFSSEEGEGQSTGYTHGKNSVTLFFKKIVVRMINLVSAINVRLGIKFSHEFWVTNNMQILTWSGLHRVVHG